MLVPALAMFLIGIWRIDRPSFWRDESVTVLVSGQPPADIVAYIRNTDAVHGAYYLLMHMVTELGRSELIARLPSVLAAALAAGGIAVIGRRLVSTRAGVLAGLIFALLPVVSRYAQEARSYAIVTALAVLATYLLLRGLATTTSRASWFVSYAVVLAVLGWLHLDAMLLVGAHAVVVLVHWRTAGSARPLAWWSGAVTAATAAVLPLVAEARSQSTPGVSAAAQAEGFRVVVGQVSQDHQAVTAARSPSSACLGSGPRIGTLSASSRPSWPEPRRSPSRSR